MKSSKEAGAASEVGMGWRIRSPAGLEAAWTAQLVITENVGEISQHTHFIPGNYLRRYTVTGELDCDADPELGCEGVWSFDLVGEQTKAEVAFRTDDR